MDGQNREYNSFITVICGKMMNLFNSLSSLFEAIILNLPLYHTIMTKKQFLEGKPFQFKGIDDVFQYGPRHKRIYKMESNQYHYYCGVPVTMNNAFEAYNLLFGKPNNAIVFFKDLTVFTAPENTYNK